MTAITFVSIMDFVLKRPAFSRDARLRLVMLLVTSAGCIPAIAEAHSIFLDRSDLIRRQIEQIESKIQTLPVSPMNACPWTLGYASSWEDEPTEPMTIKVIFPQVESIDLVALLPATYTDDQNQVQTFGFPVRFLIERILPDGSKQVIANHLDHDYIPLRNSPQLFFCPNPVPTSGILLTVTRRAPNPTWWPASHLVALSELFAFSGEKNAALNARATVSSAFYFEYIWSPECLTDGFSLYSPIDHQLSNPTKNFFTQKTKATLEIDLGDVHQIDEFRFWPIVTSLQHNFPPASGAGFPLSFKVELSSVADFSDAIVLCEEAKLSQRPGAGPLMRRVSPVSGRYVRFSLENGFRDFRRNDYVEITLSEIEILSNGNVVSAGLPFREPSDPTRTSLLVKLTDGLVNEGKILTLRNWLTSFHQKLELERQLRSLTGDLAEAQRAEKKWSKTILFIAGGLILTLIQLIWWGRVLARRRSAQMRERIACDLHDEIGANVSSIGHSAEMLLETISKPTENQASLLSNLIEIARITSRGTKHFVRFIESEDQDRNLAEQFSQVADQILSPIPVRSSYLNLRSFNRLNSAKKWNLLLFFKEALNNIIKHAGASMVEITARTDGAYFELIIIDDGRGLDSSFKSCRHLERRAKMLGGLLKVESQPGKGTRIHLRFKK